MTTTLYQLKRYDEAVAAYRQAIRMQPNLIASPTGLSEAIYALAALRRRPEAADLLKQHNGCANGNWRENAPLASASYRLTVSGGEQLILSCVGGAK